MEISANIQNTIARNAIKKGDVYLVTMNADNGIIPHDGYTTRDKYFVVLGFDSDGNVYGGVVINSKINVNLARRIADFHYPIKCSRYRFLSHDSFIDCSRLKVVKLEKLLEGRYVGEIEMSDIDLIVGTVIESPMEQRIRLRQFGLV